MSDFSTLNRPGVNNVGMDSDELFLKLFGGEALLAFQETNVALTRHVVRTIPHGKSAQFPVLGKGDAEYHDPGTALDGMTVLGSERVITIDDVLVAPRFVADIDQAKVHWDYRSALSRDIGMALARRMDQNILRVHINAANSAATVTGENGGTVITAATAGADADALVAAAFDSAEAFDEKDVPSNDRYFYVKPAQYYLLANSSSKLINRDYGNEGNGSIASGVVLRVAGMEIVKTNNLPQDEITDGPTAYQGDFRNTVAIAAQKSAVGTVKLMDLSMQMEYSVRNQGTLLVGRYAVGTDILRPECAVQIKTA